MHLFIGRETRARRQAARKPGEPPYRILASPLLIEVGRHGEVDRVLLVDTHLETQLERVMARDNHSREQAQAILDTQMSSAEKRPHADDIIDNTSTLQALYDRVDALHKEYCRLAEQQLNAK